MIVKLTKHEIALIRYACQTAMDSDYALLDANRKPYARGYLPGVPVNRWKNVILRMKRLSEKMKALQIKAKAVKG